MCRFHGQVTVSFPEITVSPGDTEHLYLEQDCNSIPVVQLLLFDQLDGQRSLVEGGSHNLLHLPKQEYQYLLQRHRSLLRYWSFLFENPRLACFSPSGLRNHKHEKPQSQIVVEVMLDSQRDASSLQI